MSTPVDQTKLARRTYRFAEQDGLTEIFAGVMLLAIAGIFGTRLGTIYLALALIFGVPALSRLRSKITYPRIGYVKTPTDPPAKMLTGMFGVMAAVLVLTAVLMAIFGNISDSDTWYRWSPAFMSVILIGMFNFLASRTGSRRYYLFAILSVAAGFMLALISFDSRMTGLVIYVSLMGVVFLVAGIIKLIVFLRRYPKPNVEVVDGPE